MFASLDYKEKNLDAVFNYYNHHSGDALRWMMVNWYGGNSNLWSPSPDVATSDMDRGRQRKYLLAENEDDL